MAMQRFASILFVATPGVEDGAVFERALRLAESHQARVTVVDVRPEPRGGPGGEVSVRTIRDALAATSAELLDSYAAADDGRVEVETRTLYGVPFVEVVRAVLRDGHDLVVKAAEAAGSEGFDSTAMHLLRKCPVPVWLARPSEEQPYGRVLAAVDFDRERPPADAAGHGLNRAIVEAAAAQALADFADLHLLHAWQPAFEGLLRSRGVFGDEQSAQRYVSHERSWHEQALEALGEQARGWLGSDAHDYLQPRLHLRSGRATQIVPAVARELGADLVVMGTVGRVGVAGLLIGNTAETILGALETSVLAVKPPGFRTPVSA